MPKKWSNINGLNHLPTINKNKHQLAWLILKNRYQNNRLLVRIPCDIHYAVKDEEWLSRRTKASVLQHIVDYRSCTLWIASNKRSITCNDLFVHIVVELLNLLELYNILQVRKCAHSNLAQKQNKRNWCPLCQKKYYFPVATFKRNN